MEKIKIGILGASGYVGADLMRLLAEHPEADIKVLTANSHAGKALAQVYPHLARLGLPDLIKTGDANWAELDVVFCGLPHGTSQEVIAKLPDHVRVIDLSADFRLRDINTYAEWYGHAHGAPELQPSAVYGLTEHYRDQIKDARLVACPGCYPTAALLLLLPLLGGGQILADDLIIDAKSGVTGAGRSVKEQNLYSEVADALHPYGIASHRHAPEIEQELSSVAGTDVLVNFTPHLIPMNRGEYLSVYAKLGEGASVETVTQALAQAYENEPFVSVAEGGAVPATRHVRGSNYVIVSAHEDRLPGRVILFSTLDNLVKGSSGQAIQNMNVMFGFEETLGLTQQPMFP